MKTFCLILLSLAMTTSLLAQKQTFDVVSFSMPKGWQQQQNAGGVQLSVTDKKTAAYAIAIITKVSASTSTGSENFTKDWNRLVKGSVQPNAEPGMQEPMKANGWDIISGAAQYKDGDITGIATLLTATGGGQTISVLLMTNTKQYEKELTEFISSLELSKAAESLGDNNVPINSNSVNNKSVVGLWTYNLLETSGYANGMPQYTAGYFRREYFFKDDSSYVFRIKNWSVYAKEILFTYETGTYTIQGNQLTISPKQGRGEWWSKKDNRASLWGSKVKASDYQLEKKTYTFEVKYYSGSKNYALLLNPNKSTQRDGTFTGPTSFSYSKDEDGKSIIDNPPGFTTSLENKSPTTPTPTQTKNTNLANAGSSSLAGKTWQAYSLEKYPPSYAATSGFNTGGFWFWQYKFNTDGTYQFVYTGASALAVNPVNVLQYETGTYSVDGSQLTITPLKGSNEEWSVGKINNGMSDSHIREVLENRLKRLKTQKRKLEKITYPFKIEYWEGNKENALMLQHVQDTEREGSAGVNNYSSFFETQPGKLSHLLPK